MELQLKKTVVRVVQVVLKNHFIHGPNLGKLGTQIIVVKSAGLQFKQNHLQVVQVVRTQAFTRGQNSNIT